MEKEQNIKKGKKYLLIGVLVLFLAILGSSVAYYLARVQGSLSGKAAGTGLDLTITPLSTGANANGDLIPLDNDKETLTMAALGYGNETTNFDATKSCIDINGYTVCQVYQITLTNKGSAPVTVNGGVELTGANTPNIDCAKMTSSTSVTSNASCKGTNTLANGEVINGGASIDYYVIVYINNLDVPQTDKGVFNGTVAFTSTQGDQIKGRFKQESEAEITLKSLGLTVDTAHTPNFGMISGNNGVKRNGRSTLAENQGDGTNGIYEAQDDLGTTYYFRGAVTNNYVTFGGLTWRIVRINGDGTIRIVLNQSIGTSAYNTNYNNNAYVGYMYGDAGSSTYAETHANTNDSTIKTVLDNWYETNLLQYEDKIADAIYCNDRSVVKFTYSNPDGEQTFSGNGVGTDTEDTAYAGYKRIFIDHTPSLICPNNNDKFTKSNALGNGALSYPIGLLTLDEYQMAGAGARDYSTGDYYKFKDSTDAFYLYDSKNWYWSMTPVQMYASGRANVGYVFGDGGVHYGSVNRADRAVRPAVSLKSSSITSGSGTSVDPFVVGGTNN